MSQQQGLKSTHPLVFNPFPGVAVTCPVFLPSRTPLIAAPGASTVPAQVGCIPPPGPSHHRLISPPASHTSHSSAVTRLLHASLLILQAID